VKVNNSGYRKLQFVNNSANSGSLPLPLAINTIIISAIATDQSRENYSISVTRDTKTTTTGATTQIPIPVATPASPGQVVSSVRFLVNSSNGFSEVAISPNFSQTKYTGYSASFGANQSTTQMKADFTGVGITLRFKANNGPFLPIPSTGASATIALNKGTNTAVLRVFSADGTSVDYEFTLIRASS
jgi:hypothetical protein